LVHRSPPWRPGPDVAFMARCAVPCTRLGSRLATGRAHVLPGRA
jgi:hypothetical protein